LGPYTLVRDRRTVTVSADADPAIDTVMLFGSFSETATGLLSAGPGDPVTPIVMIKGTGINVPGTTETSELATPITGAASEGSNFALHALTVSISCVGSATSSSGVVVLGTCQSKVSRKAFPTFTALSASLTARQEASTVSAYSLLGNAQVRTCYPLDVAEWSMQNLGVNSSSHTKCAMNDRLAPVYIVLKGGAATQYIVTIHSEWRVNYTNALMASTAVPRPMASPKLWQDAVNQARATGGAIGGALGMLGGALVGAAARMRPPLRAMPIV
jgi:hypothetical protein